MSAFWEAVRRRHGVLPNDTIAGLWDSSWFNSPSGGTRYHIDNGKGAPACTQHRALLCDFGLVEAKTVPAHMRCKRAGCAKVWRKIDG